MKELNVDKQELTSLGCRGTWKGSQIDWIVCKGCTVWLYKDCILGKYNP